MHPYLNHQRAMHIETEAMANEETGGHFNKQQFTALRARIRCLARIVEFHYLPFCRSLEAFRSVS